MSCFGSFPRKNSNICWNVSAEVEVCTCVAFGIVTFSRAFHVPFGRSARRVRAASGPHRQRSDAGILILAVEVRVRGDTRPVFGRFRAFGEVVVHHRGALGVTDDIDLRLPLRCCSSAIACSICSSTSLLSATARGASCSRPPHPPVLVAVAFEAHRLRCEVRARALEAVHEQDRPLLERLRGAFGARRRCAREEQPDGHDQGGADPRRRSARRTTLRHVSACHSCFPRARCTRRPLCGAFETPLPRCRGPETRTQA